MTIDNKKKLNKLRFMTFARFFLFSSVLLPTSCDNKLRDITMDKNPYTGDELRIDGYYYSELDVDRYVNVAVFYRDGFCIHTCIIPESQDTLSIIEDEVLLNQEFISKLKNGPSHIGVFEIIDSEIIFETWEYRNTTGTHSGTIINDTTFRVDKWVNNRSNTTYAKDLIYKFRQFNDKPDSANRFVK